MNDRDYLLIIDGSSLLTTMFYGNLPREIMFAKDPAEKAKYFYKIMQNSKGVYTNAIYGFMRTLIRIMEKQSPRYMAVAWDMSRNTFRRELDPQYKGNRSETLEPLKQQFVRCQSLLDHIGIKQFMSETYEADDYCGTLAAMFEEQVPVRIMTKDNDYLQLVSDRTHLFMMHSSQDKTDELYTRYGITKTEQVPERCFEYDPELVEKEFIVKPSMIADLKGLQGDTSDNIKGVKGVGSETAARLIAYYGSIDAMYEELSDMTPAKEKELAAKYKELGIVRSPIKALLKKDEETDAKASAFLSKKLATIKRDIDLGELKLEDLLLVPDRSAMLFEFGDLEFKSLKLPAVKEEGEQESFAFVTASDSDEAQKLIGEVQTSDIVGISLSLDGARISGIALAGSKGRTCFVPAGTLGRDAADFLRELTDTTKLLSLFDIKRFYKATGLDRRDNIHDCLIAAYVLNPLVSERDYGSVWLEEKGDELLAADSADGVQKACLEAYVACNVAQSQRDRLEECEAGGLYRDIELPLAFVLADMEKQGILVDRKALDDFTVSLDRDIDRLQSQIYEYVGESFNINSPKQLGVILFEKLRLPYGKKTKSGYSTSADVLEKLKSEDPVVEKILEYRQLTKLRSVYTVGLVDCIEEDGRIRTRFNQTVTATGRLSSSEPNLQNIPIRSEMGRLIRKAFIPSPGKVFVDADYSQIELRILASMSGDEKLIGAYRDSVDIHAATASQVFHVPLEEMTQEIRGRAKAVNFGIVYGISSFGLGSGLNISRKEAQEYIDAYFETYPAIKAFLDGLVKDATQNGYSVTHFGRRRPVPELQSQNFMQRQFGERIAMNAPIQGTAADIIKIAMIRVYERLRKDVPGAALILQIHDELLVEADEAQAQQVKTILEEEMKAAVSLKVSLEVSAQIADNWGDAH